MTDPHALTDVVDVVHAEHLLWAGVRLVVLDTETTTAGRQPHAVALAAVTCRAGLATGTWATLLNPRVPISARSTAIHGITDDHVEHEPTFIEISGQLLDTLRPRSADEVVVFVAHNAGYDLGVLRAELARTPDEHGELHEPLELLPDLPVLDTTNAKLYEAAGIHPAGRRLADLLEALGLANTRAHDAASDAGATAQAAIALLNRAAARGHTDLPALLHRIGAPTIHSAKTSTHIRRKDAGPRQLTLPHAASHGRLLPPFPSSEEWRQWTLDVTECAQHRCERLTDRIRADQAHPLATLPYLEKLITKAAEPAADGAVDRAAVNTLALAYVAAADGTDLTRPNARATYRRLQHVLAAVGACRVPDLCPGCAATGECGHDIWWRPLVASLLGPFKDPKDAMTLFRPRLNTSRKGVIVTLAKNTNLTVGGYALWLLVDYLQTAGRPNWALKVAQTGYDHDYLDPRATDLLAAAVARGGRDPDLAAALAICRKALAERGNSTDAGWRLLDARVALLASQRARLRTPLTGRVDEYGQPIPKRRHTPAAPRRTRQLRFARGVTATPEPDDDRRGR